MRKKFKYILLGIVFLIFIVGIPIGINESYKFGRGYITLWEAKDVLLYYGSLLGAFVTAGVFAGTVIFTRRQIQKQDYESRERGRWNQIDETVTSALKQIHPLKISKITAQGTQVKTGVILTELAEYAMDAKSALDMLNCHVTAEDYKRIEPLIINIVSTIDECCKISEAYSEQYNWIIQTEVRNSSLRLLEIEKQYPNSISEKRIEEYKKNVEDIHELDMNVYNQRLKKIGEDLVKICDAKYRPLLVQKRDIFDTIYKEIDSMALERLKFWRK